MKTTLLTFLCGITLSTTAQNLYFPPNNSNVWDTIHPSTLGWCQENIDSLYQLLDDENTKAFILLKDGKIVLEKYFDNFTKDSTWYWASAGKTLTAFVVGKAQEEGYLSINDSTSNYLGTGWTDLTPAQEGQITIRHHLEMTTGLDDSKNADCTDDTCLTFKAQAGTRWAYHNAPYTLLQDVVGNATGQSMNIYTFQNVLNPIGAQGLFVKLGHNKTFFSKPRSMARFGLLLLTEGNWDGTAVLSDSNYFNAMVNSSQNLNPAYGYLTWLNGKSTYKIPQSQIDFQGSLIPDAPTDMYAGIGANDQLLKVVPSQNLVFIRMGDAPSSASLVPIKLNNDIWKKINQLDCNATSILQNISISPWQIFPNPFDAKVQIEYSENGDFLIEIFDGKEVQILLDKNLKEIDTENWENDIYFLRVFDGNGWSETRKVFKAR